VHSAVEDEVAVGPESREQRRRGRRYAGSGEHWRSMPAWFPPTGVTNVLKVLEVFDVVR
jgi:predicted acyl esterase